jgi:hypothetical protein
MLVACRLAGLSALGAHYAGVKWRTMRGRRDLSLRQKPAFRLATPSLWPWCGRWLCQHSAFKLVRIAISVEAFEAIARTLPLGSVGYENKIDEHGQRLIWLDRAVVDRLRAMRGPGESYSDVILRLAAQK